MILSSSITSLAPIICSGARFIIFIPPQPRNELPSYLARHKTGCTLFFIYTAALKMWTYSHQNRTDFFSRYLNAEMMFIRDTNRVGPPVANSVMLTSNHWKLNILKYIYRHHQIFLSFYVYAIWTRVQVLGHYMTLHNVNLFSESDTLERLSFFLSRLCNEPAQCLSYSMCSKNTLHKIFITIYLYIWTQYDWSCWDLSI